MKIGIVTMQRDEGELLRTWIKYHSAIFGPQAVTVLDNGSEDPATASALSEARAAGVSVVEAEEFEKKGVYVSDFCRRNRDFDWIFPMDTDEFIGVQVGDAFRNDLAAVEEQVSRADAVRRPLIRIGRSIWNVPGSRMGYPWSFKKIAIRAGTPIELDLGFHLYSWDTMSDMVDPDLIHLSDICYVHAHNRPFANVQERARLKLKARVPDFEPETLRSYAGVGVHLVKYLLQDEQTYLAQLPKGTVDLSDVFGRHGLSVPFSGD